jgi:2-polyprenyl-3-methyl-5-hydroxy-6-metoxy-1,4-benzoquinol methylase
LDHCPCCQSPVITLGSSRDRRTGEFLVSGCSSCGLIFANPPPSREEAEARYTEGGSWQRKKLDRRKELSALNQDHAQKGPLHRAMREAAAGLHAKGKRRVLDFGCGDGKLLDELQDDGWETFGIDYAAAAGITRHVMLDELPAAPSFDLIILKNVLEHLVDPLGTLRGVRQCLKDDGTVFVSTPTLDNLHQHRRKKYCINRIHHPTAYTRRSLAHMLACVGFAVGGDLPTGVPHRMALVVIPGQGARDAAPLTDARHTLWLTDESEADAPVSPVSP